MSFSPETIDKRSNLSKTLKNLSITRKEEIEEVKLKIESGEKFCPVCKTWKGILDFHKDEASKDGYRASCKDCVCESKRKNRDPFNLSRAYSNYRKNAENRGYCFNLTLEDFVNFVRNKCCYCGTETNKGRNGQSCLMGIDRVDNNKGYTIENTAPCCWSCNHMKYQSSKEDWIGKMKAIIIYNGFVIDKGGFN